MPTRLSVMIVAQHERLDMHTLLAGPVRIICDSPDEGAWNMAVDEVLAASAAAPEGQPVIRLYGFSSSTISFGRFQSSSDLLLDRLRNDQITLVRRPTGGRAVLHDTEITYSVSLGKTHIQPFTKRQVYRFVGDLLFTVLTDLGVSCQINQVLVGDSSDPNCFGSTGEYELIGQFGKLVGSAQMVTRQGTLQHGSIPLDDSYRQLIHYLPGPTTNAMASTSSISREIGKTPSFHYVFDRMRESLLAFFTRVEIDTLTEAEKRRVTTLLPKFMSDSWTLMGKP